MNNFNLYPYTTPVVMTDDIYQKYGGLLVNTLPDQREAAYVMAEMAVSQDISTFLIPTNITGSYSLSPGMFLGNFMLDHSYVNYINWTRFYDFEQDIYYTVTGTGNVHVALRNPKFGILDLNYFLTNCACATRATMYPYQVEVAYNAGLPTGTSNSPNMLMALTTYSQIIINEILGYGNESPGDVGVTDYQNQSYRENRVGLLRTVYGTSAKANFIHKLLTPYRLYRFVGM